MDKESIFEHADVLLYNSKKDGKHPEDFFGDYHLHILCLAGHASFVMNGEPYEMQSHDFVIWQLGSEISAIDFSDDFESVFLCVSRAFLIKCNPELVWATKAFIYIKEHPVIPLADESFALFSHDFEEFRYRLSLASHKFADEVLESLLRTFLFDLWHIYSPLLVESTQTAHSSFDIFNRFMTLLSKSALTERKITYYANHLFVSPKYLSEVCRACSGKPASEWITGYSLQELQKLLRDPSITLIEISDRMNFPNYPNFTKYVKTYLGVTPKEYRATRE